jgi:hypothetical protein
MAKQESATPKKWVTDAEYLRNRRDIIRREKYERWEMNLSNDDGEIEGEIFIRKDIAPPAGCKLRITAEIVEE